MKKVGEVGQEETGGSLRIIGLFGGEFYGVTDANCSA